MPPKKATAPAKKASTPAKAPAKKTTSAPAKKPSKEEPDSSSAKVPRKQTKPPQNDRPAIYELKQNNPDMITAVAILMFSKCPSGVALLVGRESYNKWGAPSSALSPNESPDDGFKRCYEEEVGSPMPKCELKDTFNFKNTNVGMFYTTDCVENLGPKSSPEFINDLTRFPVNELFEMIASSNPQYTLRQVFVDMVKDNKKTIADFIKKIK